MIITGCASGPSTDRFRQRFAALHPTHFRPFQDLWASSIGLGTYLGDSDDATDARYTEAVEAALIYGCNVFDTAINYRCQRSERALGRSFAALLGAGRVSREELILCTKGGYLPFDGHVPADPGRYIVQTVLEPGLASYEDLVAGCHCLSPAYLEHALRASLRNLQVESVDVYFLHNPEQQLEAIDREALWRRLEQAFALLERQAADGRLRYYGVATWQGLRVAATDAAHLPLEQLVELAQRVGGAAHRFRVIQLPYNLAMPEAHAFRNQIVNRESCTVLEAAERLGLTVMVSASLLQGRLVRLPAGLRSFIQDLATDAQRALQAVRSTPGVTTALAGMKTRAHVEENLAVAQQPPLDRSRLSELFTRRGPS